MKDLINRVTSETPAWFKNVAWISSILAVICVTIITAVKADEIHLSPIVIEWVKRIFVACSAIAGISLTAKKE